MYTLKTSLQICKHVRNTKKKQIIANNHRLIWGGWSSENQVIHLESCIITRMNISLNTTKIIQAFFLNRNFSVKIDGMKSSSRNIFAGDPQGSCLAPVILNLY